MGAAQHAGPERLRRLHDGELGSVDRLDHPSVAHPLQRVGDREARDRAVRTGEDRGDDRAEQFRRRGGTRRVVHDHDLGRVRHGASPARTEPPSSAAGDDEGTPGVARRIADESGRDDEDDAVGRRARRVDRPLDNATPRRLPNCFGPPNRRPSPPATTIAQTLSATVGPAVPVLRGVRR